MTDRQCPSCGGFCKKSGCERENVNPEFDAQIGITYEEANPPQPYCKRCGKKLGTEVTDIHTCTPKEQEPIAYLCENAVGHKYFRWKKPSSEYKPIPLYIASQKKEWVGLTDEERSFLAWESNNGIHCVQMTEAKLKEKNNG